MRQKVILIHLVLLATLALLFVHPAAPALPPKKIQQEDLRMLKTYRRLSWQKLSYLKFEMYSPL